MADEKPGTEGPSRQDPGSGKEAGSAESVENFGPVSSLEPDGVGPLDDGPEGPGFHERFSISVTWEGVSEAKPAKPAGRARKAKAEAGKAGPGKPDADWTRASRTEAPRETDSENDALLLDDAFLKRTFKDVNFPARKELVLRYVDQEQDFIYGQDRTVNLHNLITQLDEEQFPTRRDLMHAVKDRLLHHHH